MKRDSIYFSAVGCIILATWMGITTTYAQETSPEHMIIHKALTQGLSAITIGRLCPVIPKRDDIYPILCGGSKAYTGDPLYLHGSYPPVVLAGHFGKGRIVACGHDNWLLEGIQGPRNPDISRLALNSLIWLAGPDRPAHIAFYTDIGTLVTTKTLSTNIARKLSEQEITVTNLTELASPENLKNYTALVIVRPHARLMDDEEADIISDYVKKGGGVLLAGLGWYWAQCNPNLSMTDFPLNVLGRCLGLEYVDDIVWQQDNQGERGPAIFQVDTPKPWRPKPTKVFQCCEMDDRAIHTFIREHRMSHNFAIEGKYTILNLPAYGFLKLQSPTKASKDLDRIYETHKNLASNIPYYGKKISFVVVNKCCYHLCSGNPVLIRRDRVPVVLNDFNGLGHPGWGLIHELGHDFVASAHKHAYQLGHGDNECWANVFTTHAYDILNLEYDKNDMHWQEQKRGITYYFSNKPDYEQLKKDNWIMLSLLTVIKDTYGWKPFYSFFQKCAERAKAGVTPTAEQEKVDFLVYELSTSAGVDLSSYFVRWGFPVSESVINELNILPEAHLDKAARSITARLNIGVN